MWVQHFRHIPCTGKSRADGREPTQTSMSYCTSVHVVVVLTCNACNDTTGHVAMINLVTPVLCLNAAQQIVWFDPAGDIITMLSAHCVCQCYRSHLNSLPVCEAAGHCCMPSTLHTQSIQRAPSTHLWAISLPERNLVCASLAYIYCCDQYDRLVTFALTV